MRIGHKVETSGDFIGLCDTVFSSAVIAAGNNSIEVTPGQYAIERRPMRHSGNFKLKQSAIEVCNLTDIKAGICNGKKTATGGS